MAASTRALTPTHSGRFGNVLDTTPSVRSLAPLSHSLRRSASPRSPKAMSPRLSPSTQPLPRSDTESRPFTATATTAITTTTAAAAEAASIVRDAATKLSTPLAEAIKEINASGNTSSSNAQTSPTSISSLTSIDAKAAPTATAPAAHEADSTPGRPIVDPGLPGVSDVTPNRAYTFPPPLGEEHPSARNLSLPNNVFASSSPRSSGSGSSSKRHKCPYCATEFTRHHNLKSHLLTHSMEKPYECTQCQSRFRRLHDLKRHTKLHTGERPHECARCGRKFARGDALARHAKGPGGCAGRRPSFIEEDPSGSRIDDSMDGVEYTAEPEHMDDSEDMNGESSPALDSRKRTRTDSYRAGQAAATYPGVAPHSAVPPVYPTSAPRSRDPSITSQHGLLAGIQHFNAGQQSFTESPKPLSPSQAPDRRGGPTLPPPGSSAHLPSIPSFPAAQHPSASGSHSSAATGPSRDMSGGSEAWEVVRQLQSQAAAVEVEHRKEVSELRGEIDKLRSMLRKESDGSTAGAIRG